MARLRLPGIAGVASCIAKLLACRSQRLRRAVKRAMLADAVTGVQGTVLQTRTPSARSSVHSDATCSHHDLHSSLPGMLAISKVFSSRRLWP